MLRPLASRLLTPAALATIATLDMALVVGVATLTPLPKMVSVGGSDKLHHVLAFIGLALPVSLLRPRWLPLAVVLLAAYGGAIELIQPLVGRSCELADWLADLAGIGLGAVIGLTVHWSVRLGLGLRRRAA